jgi:ABC-type spermidine/putrescine transport system permease subunit II
MKRFSTFNAVSLTAGFAFLYLPILLLILYSFNAGRSVAVWGGWSTKWYASVFSNQQLLDAAWITLKVAFLSASVATILGTMAALALARHGRFAGRTLFSGMVYAPLVMPEVITGLSLLLLFVSIFAALLAGHDMSGTKRFNWLHMAVFAAVTSVTIWVTYDLEMPRYGLIRLDDYDQTMLDVRADFDRPE